MSASWFEEEDPFSPIRYRYRIEEVLHKRKSQYQEIQVLRSSFFGRILVLDGVVQLTERDEFIYHEMLTHVPMHLHGNPQRVLVVGGGDGGTVREVLRHPKAEAVLAELDPEVVEVAKAYFPRLAESLDSSRLNIFYGDAADFVANATERFDVVLCDLTDPVGPARKLSETPFLESLKKILTPGGVVATQSESLYFHAQHVRQVQENLRSIFSSVGLYGVPVATYAGNWWTFSIASLGALTIDPCRAAVAGVRFYNGKVHSSSFISNEMLDSFVRGDHKDW